ncbi:MAG: 4-alpha-glucanotransferase [Rhizobiaceae bacterium]
MNQDEALRRLASEFGILASYIDMAGIEQKTSPETMRALLNANGLELNSAQDSVEHLRHHQATKANKCLPQTLVGIPGRRYQQRIQEGWSYRLIHESNQAVLAEGRSNGLVRLPSLPLGVHVLEAWSGTDKQECLLIIAPTKAPSLQSKTAGTRVWGINAALYGLHSKSNPEFGTYGELAALCELAAASGADFAGINPVHAIGWCDGAICSPYSPTHRGFLNTGHIDLNLMQYVSQKTMAMIEARPSNAQNNPATGLIDYVQFAQTHHPILESGFKDFVRNASEKFRQAFSEFCDDQGEQLALFADFETRSERLGSDWRSWQADQIDDRHTRKIVGPLDAGNRPMFHAWLQWLADRQLTRAHDRACKSGMGFGLYLDLAVGARRSGAEAWCERNVIAQGISIGAPPDHLSPAGQNWNLSGFAPAKLRNNRFAAFRRILRKVMQHCGVIRIDHILGFDRSFWIPDNGAPGGYVRQDFEALIALTRLEAHLSNTIVVGEDLGLVPDGIRAKLKSSGIYSYSVWQFEKTKAGRFKSPSRLRAQSLACFGTHDTPTLAGYTWAVDIDWWNKLGWVDEEQAKSAKSERKRDVRLLAKHATPESREAETCDTALTNAVYGALACSNVAMVSVQLDDIMQARQAQNLPGTIDEHPNWKRRYELSVTDMDRSHGIADIGIIMAENGRSNATKLRKEYKQ